MTAAHRKETLGQYVEEGELICLIEEPTVLEADIELAEQDVGRVRDGQLVQLKSPALPFQAFQTRVARIAPSAEPAELQSSVKVVCQLDGGNQSLRPGMTGYARVYTNRFLGARLRSVKEIREEVLSRDGHYHEVHPPRHVFCSFLALLSLGTSKPTTCGHFKTDSHVNVQCDVIFLASNNKSCWCFAA